LEAGLPEGVVNIITGYGETAGAAMPSHPDIDKVAFTGSTEVGKLILQASVGNLKRVSLELGGKSPSVIFPDADLDDAIATSLFGFCMLSGQVCFAGTRVFVQSDFHDRFVEHLTRYASNVKAAHPLNANSVVRPLVSREQLNRVKRYLDVGRKYPQSLLKRVCNSARVSRPEVQPIAKPKVECIKSAVCKKSSQRPETSSKLSGNVFANFHECAPCGRTRLRRRDSLGPKYETVGTSDRFTTYLHKAEASTRHWPGQMA
jgi:hypothetical protein